MIRTGVAPGSPVMDGNKRDIRVAYELALSASSAFREVTESSEVAFGLYCCGTSEPRHPRSVMTRVCRLRLWWLTMARRVRSLV